MLESTNLIGIFHQLSIARANDQLIDAELELANDIEERIALLQQRVELMTNLLKVVEEMARAGEVTQASVLSAKADLLKARINLERERDRRSVK